MEIARAIDTYMSIFHVNGSQRQLCCGTMLQKTYIQTAKKHTPGHHIEYAERLAYTKPNNSTATFARHTLPVRSRLATLLFRRQKPNTSNTKKTSPNPRRRDTNPRCHTRRITTIQRVKQKKTTLPPSSACPKNQT
jgi:hypothetical protein